MNELKVTSLYITNRVSDVQLHGSIIRGIKHNVNSIGMASYKMSLAPFGFISLLRIYI